MHPFIWYEVELISAPDNGKKQPLHKNQDKAPRLAIKPAVNRLLRRFGLPVVFIGCNAKLDPTAVRGDWCPLCGISVLSRVSQGLTR